jgi:pSer/pThr/pTyr-binding forkhead associated (FHA) protein
MSAAGPRLVRIHEEGQKGEVFPLRPGMTVIGRRDADLTFPDDHVLSSKHASIRVETVTQEDGSTAFRCTLKDEGSLNGVYVRIRGPQRLRHGDHVAIGKQVIRFELRHPSDPFRRVS